MNLYEIITEIQLESKLIRLSVSKAGIASFLSEDAAQEIRTAWLRTKVNLSFSEGEVTSYAYRIAYTTALQVRRNLGSPVRLPGSAFRFRPDGSQYIQKGHLAAPIKWDDLPEWRKIDESTMPIEEDPPWILAADALITDACLPESTPQIVKCLRKTLTKRQLRLVSLLAQGKSFKQIEYTLDITGNAVARNFRNIKKKLHVIQ